MPWVPAASPHGPVTSPRTLTLRVTAVLAVAAAARREAFTVRTASPGPAAH